MADDKTTTSLAGRCDDAYCRSHRVAALISIFQHATLQELDDGYVAYYMDVLGDESRRLTIQLDELNALAQSTGAGGAS